MSQKVRMTNKSLKWILIIVITGLAVTAISYTVKLSDTCYFRQLGIVGEIKKYDSTKDSEFCDTLNEKISHLNDECKSGVEELDCG